MEEVNRLLDKQLTVLKETKNFIMAGDQIMKEILIELKDIGKYMRELGKFLGVKYGEH